MHADVNHLLSIIFFNAKNLKQAEEHALRAVAAQSSPKYLHTLGEILRFQGQLKDALLQYESVVALEPRHFESNFGMGLCFAGMGRLQEAVLAYSRALKIRPGNYDAMFNTGFDLLAPTPFVMVICKDSHISIWSSLILQLVFSVSC
jgi:tetratricopeptide (TPR) repeat protein